MIRFFERLEAAGLWKTAPFTALDEFAKTMRASIVRQYVGDEANRKRTGIRVSSLGKPAVLSALSLPSVKEDVKRVIGELPQDDEDEDGDAVTERLRLIFHTGDWFEAWVAFQLDRLGYNRLPIPEGSRSEDDQWRIEYQVPGLDVPVVGHLDHVVESEQPGGSPIIVEVKTMSDNYFKSFTGLGYSFKDDNAVVYDGGDDERGYMTQLALYMSATGFDGAWLCLNKATSQMALVHPSTDDLAAALSRANKVAHALSNVHTLEDVFTKVAAPPGVPEIYKRKPTGMLLVPPSMKWSGLTELFYDIEYLKNGYGKKTAYVGDFDPAEYNDFGPRDYMQHTRYKTYEDVLS